MIKNETIINKAVQTAIDIALDDKHGYSQYNRNGPDFDCSSLVLYCYASAGLDTHGATYTGNMRSCLSAAGFKALKYPCDLIKGDIILNEKCHTVIYIGEGQIVEATLDENGKIGQNAKTGDQTGHEIHITNMYTYYKGWDWVLRLEAQNTYIPPLLSYCYTYLPEITWGDISPATCAAQAALNYHGYGCIDTDGVFGDKTMQAVKRFQHNNGLTADGIIGKNTWSKLMTWR